MQPHDQAHLCDLQGANEVDLNVPAKLLYGLVHEWAVEGSAGIVHQGEQGVAVKVLSDLQEEGLVMRRSCIRGFYAVMYVYLFSKSSECRRVAVDALTRDQPLKMGLPGPLPL